MKKKIIASLIVLFFICQYGFAIPTDTTFQNTVKLIDKTDSLRKKIDSMKILIDTTLRSGIAKKECNCIPVITEINGCGKWFLILSPFYLLVLVVLIVAIGLRNFKFTDALTENEPPKKIIKNPEYTSSGIAANAGISNLTVLFPPTIEVSNILPGLVELREIAAAKASAVLAVQTSLDTAKAKTEALKKAVSDAELAKNPAATQLQQNVTDAQTELKNAKEATTPVPETIAAAQKKLDDAQKLVAENEAVTATLEAAKKNALENADAITRLTALLPKAQAEASDAKANVDFAATAEENKSVSSINTYRPSISRYIAFVTSLVTILLVVCMSSFFIYHYIRTGCPPEFGALTSVLIALGLGVTPYITNKISTVAVANKS